MPDWTSLRQSILGEHPRRVLPARVRLPVLPRAAMQFSKACQNPDATPDELGKIIETDSGLMCDLLRHVNSSAFGLRLKVSTPKKAIACLGIRESRLFLLTVSLSRALKSCESKLIDMRTFAAANLERALFAQEVAGLLSADADLAYSASMLADFVLPVVTNQLFPSYYEFIQQNDGSAKSLMEFERSSLGWDHTVAGAQVMFDWNFPDDLICCVLLHHQGLKLLGDPKFRSTAAAAVAVASFIPDQINQVPNGLQQLQLLDRKWSAFDLSDIASRVDEQFQEMGVGADKHDSLLQRCRNQLAVR